jgi:hypothetical protein
MTASNLLGLGLAVLIILQLLGLIVLWQIWRKDDDDSWDL